MANKREPLMRFKAHGSFFIRKGWLGKGLRAINESQPPYIFNPGNVGLAMDELGLGKNMVGALRYWMKTLGLISENRHDKSMSGEQTDFGKLIFENDPYVEEIGTLWCLHCVLVAQKYDATSWYWLFNEAGVAPFSKEEAADGIQKYAVLRNAELEKNKKSGAARKSIEDDVDCLLSTYISQERKTGKKTSPENVIDCPLGELGIIDIDDGSKKTYRKRQPSLALLPAEIVLFSMAYGYNGGNPEKGSSSPVVEIPLDELLNGKNYPGRVFNLDSVALLSKLYELENDQYIRINRTAGSDVVRLCDPGISPNECLRRYYEMIG